MIEFLSQLIHRLLDKRNLLNVIIIMGNPGFQLIVIDGQYSFVAIAIQNSRILYITKFYWMTWLDFMILVRSRSCSRSENSASSWSNVCSTQFQKPPLLTFPQFPFNYPLNGFSSTPVTHYIELFQPFRIPSLLWFFAIITICRSVLNETENRV